MSFAGEGGLPMECRPRALPGSSGSPAASGGRQIFSFFALLPLFLRRGWFDPLRPRRPTAPAMNWKRVWEDFTLLHVLRIRF